MQIEYHYSSSSVLHNVNKIGKGIRNFESIQAKWTSDLDLAHKKYNNFFVCWCNWSLGKVSPFRPLKKTIFQRKKLIATH